MPFPPNQYNYTLSQADLNQKYEREGWANQMQNWARVAAGDTSWATGARGQRIREVHSRYRDDDGNTMAYIIDYTHADGTTTKAVRMLRDDHGVQWGVAPPPEHG